MLNPNKDRLDYGSILSAPPNYELDFAIGTTYSLDLDSLIGASISLELSEETDTILRKNPIFLLKALRCTGDKIALFCENGRIKLPKNPTRLYILLEEMVFQVNTPKNVKFTNYPSFHPKFWLIRYVNGEEVIYRIIVLSRNLTFDRNWDISFTMDGKKVKNSSNSIKDKNKNLTIFLDYLKEYSTNPKKTDKINDIIKELDYVKFDLGEDTFEDFDFIPNGVSDNVSIEMYPLFDEKFYFDDLVIITPFLSGDVIKKFNNRAKEYEYYQKSIKDPKKTRLYLFTRAESLSKLKHEECDKFRIYILRNEIINGESNLEEFESDKESNLKNRSNENESNLDEIIFNESKHLSNQNQDIHAKIYFVRKGKHADLYLGSLNASRNALYGNVEFMVHLKTNAWKYNLKKLLNDLCCCDKKDCENPFESVNIRDYPEENPGEDLDSILKDIAHLNFKSKITFDGEFFKINLNVENFSEFEKNYSNKNLDISIKPLYYPTWGKFSKSMSFGKLNKSQLSTFFGIRIKSNEESKCRIIKIETEGMPNDRENGIISHFLNDEIAFRRYIALLLDDNSILSALESGILSKKTVSSSNSQALIQLPALYEKMLEATVNNQDKFKEIEILIQSLSGRNIIPKGFEELYNTFKEVLDNEYY